MPDQIFAKTSFYVVAHADDWQLFMQPFVYYDLTDPTCKVVIIVTTAGDAGFDENFWKAREEGAKSSIKFCLAPLGPLSEAAGETVINGHPVTFWSVNNNCVCYFLRLPDGNLDGKGFSTNGYQSLGKLRSNEINRIFTVDNSTIYNSWFDLHSTLQEIIELQSFDLHFSTIHYLNPDINANPNDHQDHVATGFALQDIPHIGRSKQVQYVGYSVDKHPANVDLHAFFWKSAMFAAYEKALYDEVGYSTLKESIPGYLRWCTSEAEYIKIEASCSNK